MDSLSLYVNNSLLSSKFSQYMKDHTVLNYNDMKESIGNVPVNWDQLTEQIKAYGQNVIALGGGNNIESSSEILIAMMLQQGAQMTSDDKSTATFQTALNLINETAYPGTQALKFYTSFAQSGQQNYTWPNNQNSLQAFKDEKLMMMIDYRSRKESIQKSSQVNFSI